MGPGGPRGQQLTGGPWVLEASVPTRVLAVAGGWRVQLRRSVPVCPLSCGFSFFFSSVRSRGRGSGGNSGAGLTTAPHIHLQRRSLGP